MPVLLNTAYFPPIQYFALMAKEMTATRKALVYIEACENYQKQSYRNRCHFYSDTGRQALSFPIVHIDGSHNNIPITEVEVDYSSGWVVRHERAIVSAYRTSAYFEYYCDDLFGILDRRPETLWELDLAIMKFFIDKIGIPVEIRPTDSFSVPAGAVCGEGVWKGLPYCPDYDACDLRNVIHPKRPDDIMERLDMKKPYFQVFSGKYGFIPSLSIMDLLFNEGPDSISYICHPERSRQAE